jgi:tetratricopeptide (TPR) repeat protein
VWGYSVREVSRVLGLTAPRIRRWSRDGLVAPRRGPRGELRFGFQDLLLLRTARDLLASRLPGARVKRALRQLRAQLPADRSLAGVRVTVDGDRVVVRDGAGAWHPESGQALLDFQVRDVASLVAPLLLEGREPRRAVADNAHAAGGARSADDFYEWACDLEGGAPEQAREAYRRALALDPRHYGSHVNLGRLLHESGDLRSAERHYRLALEVHPDDAGALFNLGVALEDQGRREEALAAYQACLAGDPSHADAHHNAGRLCEKLGRRSQALRHLGAARRLLRGLP